MYGRLYDKFQNWLEDCADRAYYASISWFVTRTIPELKRWATHRDRLAVMMVASTEYPPPRGRRLLLFVGVIVLLSALGIFVEEWIATLLAPRVSRVPFALVIALLCVMAAVILFGVLDHLMTLDHQRHAIYRILANLDEAVCPSCGYDLKGHLAAATEHDIRCPECGMIVPRLTPSMNDDGP